MPNPFKYGTIVTGEDFADREDELNLLIKELTNGQNILLYSPRRYGKSSLVSMALEKLSKEGILTAFIDVYGCVFLSDFIDKIVKATIAPAYEKMDKAVNFLKSALSGLRPVITVNPADGSFEISYKKEVTSIGEKQVLSEVLDAPEKLALAKNKPLVVVFDEFQEIKNFNGWKIENLMRTYFQHHKHVTYVFMGSKQHLMQEMISDSNRPFFKFAKPIPLGKIPKEKFKNFILEKFKKTNITINPSTVDEILTFTDGHPYFTQQVAHEIWNIACEKGAVQDNDFSKTVDSILQTHNDIFVNKWEQLTVFKKKLLVGLSQENQSAIYSTAFIQKFELASASHVTRAIKSMLEDETLEKINGAYALTDILFKEWIKRQSNKP